MTTQTSLLDEIEAGKLAEKGLSRAVDKVNKLNPEWKEECWKWFMRWLAKKPQGYHFLVEEFRNDLVIHNKIEMPENNRVFGFIGIRARNLKLVASAGKAKTKAKKSHSANAEVWVKL